MGQNDDTKAAGAAAAEGVQGHKLHSRMPLSQILAFT